MLNFDMSKIPEEMREASRKLQLAVIRERKARKQYQAWSAELADAEGCLRAENESYGTVSLRWDPETQTMAPALEELQR